MMKRFYLLGILISLLTVTGFGQDVIDQEDLIGSENALEYAVPFLTIASDSRAGAMGDAGAATAPDYNSMHWNPAKYAFIKSDMGFAVSYTPWLRGLGITDINIYNVAFYKRIDSRQTVAATLLYFDLGNIEFRDDDGNAVGQHNPYELSFDMAYSRAFTDRISGGMAFRYVRSDITGGAASGSTETKAGNAVAADISMYYENNDVNLNGLKHTLSFGFNISNLGTKISYTEIEKDFLPTNLRIGGAFKYNADEYNSLTIAADLNKLLVPTPPTYNTDGDIIAGYDPDVSVLEGAIQSFYDAPGGFDEEIHELKYSIGVEYWYANQFAVRAGYFNEHETKGNRKYFTAGAGLRLNVFTIDFSYLLPLKQNNPLANTMRFTLGLDFEALRSQKREKNG